MHSNFNKLTQVCTTHNGSIGFNDFHCHPQTVSLAFVNQGYVSGPKNPHCKNSGLHVQYPLHEKLIDVEF